MACSLLAMAAGCRPAERAARQVTVAEFEGVIDPRAGTMTIRALPSGLRLASLTDIPVSQDGVPGTGTADTVELVTETATYDCGRASSFCADVTVRSFYTAMELHNVFVELTAMTPSTGGLGFAKTAAPIEGEPGFGQVGVTYGLWRYPALLDTGTVETPTSTAGSNAATRRWYFDNLTGQQYRFVGRVMADQVTPVAEAIDLLATCGTETPAATPLDTTTDCGECGRTAPDGSTCSYAVVAGTRGADAIGFGVTCPAMPEPEVDTACDSASSTAFSCVDLQTDANNCGVCGNSCGVDGTCTAGVCGVQCASTDTPCGTACCPAGSSCSAGACVLDDAVELAVGTDHACVVTTTSRMPTLTWVDNGAADPTWPNNVVCWGQNHLGPWGDPVWTRGLPVPEYFAAEPQYHLNTDMFGVTSGHFESAALTSTPGIAGRRWGAELPYSGFNPVAGWTTRANQIAAGEDHGCGRFNFLATQDPPTRGTNPEGIYCWGFNSSGAIGNGSTDESLFCLTDGAEAVPPNALTCFPLSLTGKAWYNVADGGLTATDIASGGDTTCVVEAAPGCSEDLGQCHGEGQTAGRVACWGDNTDGKAGQADTTPKLYAPVELPTIEGAVEVSVGHRHGVARLANGDLAFWGSNAEGQYGDGTVVWTAGVVAAVPGVGATSVAAGNGFTCYVSGGLVHCAGRNDRGQLGDGTTDDSSSFVQVLGVSGATLVRAGGVPGPGDTAFASACALTGGGNVLCWGDNQQGQLGRGTQGTDPATDPVPALVELEPNPALTP